MLKRSGFIKRSSPMKRAGFKKKTYAEFKQEEKTYFKKVEHTGDAKRKPWRKTKFKKISASQRRKLGKYFPIQKEFLRQPENRWCIMCICISTDTHIDLIKPILALDPEIGDRMLLESGAVLTPSTENHHIRGRNASLLCDKRFFCPSCRGHREFPNDHARKSRDLGFLAERSLYDVPVPLENS